MMGHSSLVHEVLALGYVLTVLKVDNLARLDSFKRLRGSLDELSLEGFGYIADFLDGEPEHLHILAAYNPLLFF